MRKMMTAFTKKNQPLKVDEGDVDRKTIKAAKLVVGEGNWSCKYQWWCIAQNANLNTTFDVQNYRRIKSLCLS